MGRIFASAFFVMLLSPSVYALGPWEELLARESLTDGFWGVDNALEEQGISFNRSVTQVYQQNVRGGLSTHRRSGRYEGSYDVGLSANLERILGIEAALVYVHVEGFWSFGVDPPSVGSFFNVNGDAYGNGAIVVTEFYYEQDLFDEALDVRVGKLDPTGGYECKGCAVSFDTNRYANDQKTQFLNQGLINNPSIPFPSEGPLPTYALGIILHLHPEDWWYATAGMIDGESEFREMGFTTTFRGESAFLYLFEGGLHTEFSSAQGPLAGTYRAGFWVDGQDKERFSDGDNHRNDVGLYLSCDQMLVKENDLEFDSQGLAAFFRYGLADSDRNSIANFWSLGLQYQGLIERREDDVLGVGMAQAFFSDEPRANDGKPFTDDYEMAWELYYNAQVTPWCALSPSVQYIQNPGGAADRSDAVVLGFRAQMVF